MKSSSISKTWFCLIGLFLALCAHATEKKTSGLEAVKAKAIAMEKVLRINQELETIIKLLRALQPEETLQYVEDSSLPEPMKDLFRGWSFHQIGNYEQASTFFHKIDPKELEEDDYFTNRLDELKKTADELREFEVLETENFSIRYQSGPDQVMLLFLPEILERIYDRFSVMFQYKRDKKIIVELMPDHRLFSYASALSKSQIETTGTIALCVENRLVVLTPRRVALGYYWPDVISHEFVHYILTKQSADQVPLWMQEGVAKYFEARWEREDANPLEPGMENSLVQAIENDSLLKVEDMMPSFAALPTAALARQAYAQTTTMIDYLVSLRGGDIIHQIVVGLKEHQDMDLVLNAYLGKDFESFESDWRDWLKQQPLQSHDSVAEMGVSLLESDAPVEQIEELEARNQESKKHVRLGDLLLERNRYQAALKEYLKKQTPEGEKLDRQILLRMLRCYLFLERHQEMLTLLENHVENLDQDTTMLVHMARATLGLNRTAEAKGMLERATRINPFNPSIFQLLLSLDQEDLTEIERERYSRALDYLTNPRPRPIKDSKS